MFGLKPDQCQSYDNVCFIKRIWSHDSGWSFSEFGTASVCRHVTV